MSEEQQLQNDDAGASLNENLDAQANIEDPGIGAGLAPASDEQHEEQAQVENKVEDDVEAKAKQSQDAIQKTINEKVFKQKQAERERDEFKQKLDAIEQEKQAKLAATFTDAPNLPAYPTDEFDDNHEANVAKYHQDMATYQQQFQAKATWDAQQGQIAQNQRYAQEQAALQQQQENQKVVIEHNARAKVLNIGESEMMAAENAVLAYGIQPDCLMHIVKSDDSPLIIKHLAENPQAGFELANMSPFAVDAFLSGIRTKTEELKPRTTQTPKPVEQLSGKSAKPDVKRPMSAGAKFE